MARILSHRKTMTMRATINIMRKEIAIPTKAAVSIHRDSLVNGSFSVSTTICKKNEIVTNKINH